MQKLRWATTHSLLPRPAIPLTILSLLAVTMGLSAVAQSQTYTILHSFSGPDGYNPEAGVTLDAAGNVYGTTFHGGSQNCSNGCGTVFKLTHRSGGWVLTTLYEFQGGSDSAWPNAGVTIGPDGTLYGTTLGDDGGLYGYGTVFNLRPPDHICHSVSCPWTMTVLYSFSGGDDGGTPGYGNLVFDRQGNIYGTTANGGDFLAGTVFEVMHSNGGWTESVLYSFLSNPSVECTPLGGVIFDRSGNLWGTTSGCSSQFGAVFELSPSDSGWTASLVHAFHDTLSGGSPDGTTPLASLTLDSSGNLYGTTVQGPPDPNCPALGTVFEINTAGDFATLHFFPSIPQPECMYESGLLGPVSVDTQGNLYGTQYGEAYGAYGGVFERGPLGWSELVNFSADTGTLPWGGVALDASGNLYGTASGAGPGGGGVVWEITP